MVQELIGKGFKRFVTVLIRKTTAHSQDSSDETN